VPGKSPLKLTKAFNAVYRQGRWARGRLLSVGANPNGLAETRIGMRTRRGMKGAVRRNRLKRQMRTVLYGERLPLEHGFDLVVVIHPPELTTDTAALKREMDTLCKRLRLLR